MGKYYKICFNILFPPLRVASRRQKRSLTKRKCSTPGFVKVVLVGLQLTLKVSMKETNLYAIEA